MVFLRERQIENHSLHFLIFASKKRIIHQFLASKKQHLSHEFAQGKQILPLVVSHKPLNEGGQLIPWKIHLNTVLTQKTHWKIYSEPNLLQIRSSAAFSSVSVALLRISNKRR